MDAELNLHTIDRTSNVPTTHINLHLTNPSRGWSLTSIYFTVVSIFVFISVFVAIWRVFISRLSRASAPAFEKGSWSHITSEGESFYGGSDREEVRVHDVEAENKGRRWAEYEFLARLAGRTKSD